MSRIAILGVLLCLGMALDTPVRAQSPEQADQNLRALRMAEVELFGHAPAPSEAQLDGLTPPSLPHCAPLHRSATGSRIVVVARPGAPGCPFVGMIELFDFSDFPK